MIIPPLPPELQAKLDALPISQQIEAMQAMIKTYINFDKQFCKDVIRELNNEIK